MKAITVRDSTGILLCFGPAEGGYDPSVPVDAIKTIEDDYTIVLNEYTTNQAQLPRPLTEIEKFKTTFMLLLQDPDVKVLLKESVK